MAMSNDYCEVVYSSWDTQITGYVLHMAGSGKCLHSFNLLAFVKLNEKKNTLKEKLGVIMS